MTRKRRTAIALTVGACTVVSGITGWVLIFAAMAGHRLALVGWVFSITTTVSAIAFLHGIGKTETPREGK